MPRFRCRARNFIITFPQVAENVQPRFDDGTPFLERVTADFGNPLCCRLGRERHADGGVHYHVYLGFDKIVSINSATAFDYFGAHGNIKSVRRTPHKVFDYVGKDGDIRLDHGEPPAEASSRDGTDSNKWADIISCDTKESFLSAVREQAPRDWLLSNQRILEYANLYYPEEKPQYEAPHITVERERYPEISEWENQAAIGDCRPERVKSLILWGPTRTGKTLYARSLGEHAYFNLQFNMDEFSDDCKYAVFDDIQGGFEYFHSYKGWLGAQKQFVITDKYRKKRTIYWGKPSIMCMNEDPHFAKGVDYDWLMYNCVIVNVIDPICHVTS